MYWNISEDLRIQFGLVTTISIFFVLVSIIVSHSLFRLVWGYIAKGIWKYPTEDHGLFIFFRTCATYSITLLFAVIISSCDEVFKRARNYLSMYISDDSDASFEYVVEYSLYYGLLKLPHSYRLEHNIPFLLVRVLFSLYFVKIKRKPLQFLTWSAVCSRAGIVANPFRLIRMVMKQFPFLNIFLILDPINFAVFPCLLQVSADM